MKKGFFLSLTAVIVLMAAVFFLQMEKSATDRQRELDSAYLRDKLSADYADDVATVYLPAALAYSGKFAFVNASYIASMAIVDVPVAMTELLRGGSFSGETLHAEHQLRSVTDRTIATVNTGVTVERLNFTVIDAWQHNPWTVDFKTEVNMTLSSGKINWTDSRNYTTRLDMSGVYNIWDSEPIQPDVYGVNTSRPCILGLISGDPCSVDGISPLP
jgi:hypothetical protein